MEDSIKILLSLCVIVILAIVAIALIRWIMAHLGIAAIILLIGLFIAFIVGKK